MIMRSRHCEALCCAFFAYFFVNGENYIFSSNGDYYGHPDKEVVAELIDKTNATLWFNYEERGKSMITKQDQIDYPDVMDRIKGIE